MDHRTDTINSYTYTYDDANKVLTDTPTTGATRTYGYDAANQLVTDNPSATSTI